MRRKTVRDDRSGSDNAAFAERNAQHKDTVLPNKALISDRDFPDDVSQWVKIFQLELSCVINDAPELTVTSFPICIIDGS